MNLENVNLLFQLVKHCDISEFGLYGAILCNDLHRAMCPPKSQMNIFISEGGIFWHARTKFCRKTHPRLFLMRHSAAVYLSPTYRSPIIDQK